MAKIKNTAIYGLPKLVPNSQTTRALSYKCCDYLKKCCSKPVISLRKLADSLCIVYSIKYRSTPIISRHYTVLCCSKSYGIRHNSHYAYLSTFRNFHGGDSMRNKIFGHFLYDLACRENHLKFSWGRLFFKTKRRLNNKAFCFKR